MNTATTANLVGITGIVRRLVMGGTMDEAATRAAMAKATEAKVPLAQFIAEKKLVGAGALAAANAVEFGMPLLDVSAFDPAQNAMKLVSEELAPGRWPGFSAIPICWSSRSLSGGTRLGAPWSGG